MKLLLLGAIVVGLAVPGGAYVATAASSGVRHLDEVSFLATAFDLDGTMLWTTDESRLTNDVLFESPWLAGNHTRGVKRIVVGWNAGLGDVVAPIVLGAREGDVVRTGSIPNPLRGETVTIGTIYGPFNLTGSAPLAFLEAALGRGLSAGETFPIDGFVNATILAFEGDRATYRYDIVDGARYRVADTTLVAVAEHLPGERWHLKLEVAQGQAYEVPKRCKLGYLNFAPGTYRALEVRDDEVVWEHTTYRLNDATSATHLMAADEVVLEIEVVDVGKFDGWGRRLKEDVDAAAAPVLAFFGLHDDRLREGGDKAPQEVKQ